MSWWTGWWSPEKQEPASHDDRVTLVDEHVLLIRRAPRVVA